MCKHSNDLIIYSNLKDRDLRAEGMFIAEGRFLVKRVLETDLKLQSILCLPSLSEEYQRLVSCRPADLRVPVITSSRSELEKLCGYSFHRGVLAAGYRPSESTFGSIFNKTSRLIIGSDIRDPFNLGGLFRSASALGWEGIVLIDGCADPYSRAALRASMGSVFNLPWVSGGGEIIEALKASGFTLTGAVLPRPGSIDVEDLKSREGLLEKTALMFGNEGSGLNEDRIGACNQLISISMTDMVDSLNVGVAAGILMYRLNIS